LGVARTGDVRDRWLRRAHAGLWTLLFALGGFAVASAWEPLVAGLVRGPVPVSPEPAPSSLIPASSAGERALAEARHHLDQGRPGEALQALLAVKPEQPEYPFSLQLREQAQRALQRSGQDRHR
jgi:hypothetical protein